MTNEGRHRLAASVLVLVLGTACGGGEERSVGVAREPGTPPIVPASAPTAGPPRPRAAAPKVAARARPPVVVDRGTDHVAIARSLLMWGRWLDADRPDPALVGRAYAAGSAIARNLGAELAALRAARRRIIEIDRAPPEFAVLSRRRDVVSFRVTEHLERRDLVDARGRVLDHVGPATEHYVVSIMRVAPGAPWRLNLVEREGPPIEVQL